MENRRDDWHNSVDERLVNLTSAQKSADTNLDEIELELTLLDHVLRGDPERNLEGVLEEVHLMQKEINKFNAILKPDHLGNGGLIHDIQTLMGKRDRSEKREGYFWTFFTAVFVQFLILIGLVIVNWDRIKELWPKEKPDRLEAMIEKAKHPKPKHRHYVIREKPETADPEAEPKQEN